MHTPRAALPAKKYEFFGEIVAKANKQRADDLSTEGIELLARALEATKGCANDTQTNKTLDAHFGNQ